MKKYNISTPQDMIDLGEKLSREYKKLLLYADLGAGKTHLVKGFAKGLGVDMDKVHSPTYVYFHEYDDKLLHIDMYRVVDSARLIRGGIWDKIQDYDYICIERPRFESSWISDDWIKVDIKINGDERIVEIG